MLGLPSYVNNVVKSEASMIINIIMHHQEEDKCLLQYAEKLDE